MQKELFIASSPHETKVAVLENDSLVEVYFERDTQTGLVGGIYKGRVSRVLPGMQSAFVDIGLDRDAFLYVSDFYEDAEEYDRIVADAEARVTRLTDARDVSRRRSGTSSGGIFRRRRALRGIFPRPSYPTAPLPFRSCASLARADCRFDAKTGTGAPRISPERPTRAAPALARPGPARRASRRPAA